MPSRRRPRSRRATERSAAPDASSCDGPLRTLHRQLARARYLSGSRPPKNRRACRTPERGVAGRRGCDLVPGPSGAAAAGTSYGLGRSRSWTIEVGVVEVGTEGKNTFALRLVTPAHATPRRCSRCAADGQGRAERHRAHDGSMDRERFESVARRPRPLHSQGRASARQRSRSRRSGPGRAGAEQVLDVLPGHPGRVAGSHEPAMTGQAFARTVSTAASRTLRRLAHRLGVRTPARFPAVPRRACRTRRRAGRRGR